MCMFNEEQKNSKGLTNTRVSFKPSDCYDGNIVFVQPSANTNKCEQQQSTYI